MQMGEIPYKAVAPTAGLEPSWLSFGVSPPYSAWLKSKGHERPLTALDRTRLPHFSPDSEP